MKDIKRGPFILSLYRTISLARILGVAPHLVFSEIRQAYNKQRSSFTPALEILSLALKHSAQLSTCSHFGLLVGSHSDWLISHPAEGLVRNALSFEAALSDYVRWQIHDPDSAAYMLRTSDGIFFGYSFYQRKYFPHFQLYDLFLAAAWRTTKCLCGPRMLTAEFFLCRTKPLDLRSYLHIFGDRLHFNQEQCGIFFPGNIAHKPIAGACVQRRQRALLELEIHSDPKNFVNTLRAVIRPILQEGDPSLKAAARKLGVSTRTLQRYLTNEGICFENIRDEIRRAWAIELLEMTDLPLIDISAALAFSSASVFSQTFVRWTTVSPSTWRFAARLIPPKGD